MQSADSVTVVLVESDALVRMPLAIYLRECGYRVIECANGDEAVSVQQWTEHFGALLGVTPEIVVTPIPGASVGSVGDPTKRISITGPCTVPWRDGFRELVDRFHPDRLACALEEDNA